MLFRSDPCGIICLVITYGAVFYSDYVILRHLIMTSMSDTLWGAVNAIAYNIIVFLIMVSHVRAVFSDPGIVQKPSVTLDFSDIQNGVINNKRTDGWSVCIKCEAYRPPRAHHCRVCRRCIRRMDHHCPWINNCVGEYNQKFFIQFLFYVGLASIYSITMVIVCWVLDPGITKHQHHLRLVHSAALVVESLMFGLFVVAIGCDQLNSILADETAVEYVKQETSHKANKSSMTLLRNVFGGGHPVCWLCPFKSDSLLSHGSGGSHIV